MILVRGFRPELLAPLLGDLAAQGALGEIPVRGTSMRPTLLDGDRVRLVPATQADVRVGDLVVRTGQAGPIIHRLVGWWPTLDGWRMLTKGDGVRRLDPPLSPDGLVGRVVARVRKGEVREVDEMGIRLCGRGRAVVSLAVGIIVEAWDRGRRVARQWAGWPEA